MKAETLNLANRIAQAIKDLKRESNNFKYTRSEIGSMTTINFTILEYTRIQNEANERIQIYIKGKLNDLNCFLEGLCDETQPIIQSSFISFLQIKNLEEKESTKTEVPMKKKPKKAVTVANTKCPFGHIFGLDNDLYDSCQKCSLWDECFDECDEL